MNQPNASESALRDECPCEFRPLILDAKERYKKLGGEIKVIVRQGFKHHPHGLDDPAPIMDFILQHTKQRRRHSR